jgi:hypothetical protein
MWDSGSGMSPTLMRDPGAAQLELIRRYARTLRELHADAMRHRGPRIGAREARGGITVEPVGDRAPAVREAGRTGPPTAPPG